jgi:ABC-2 type transport system permease protein
MTGQPLSSPPPQMPSRPPGVLTGALRVLDLSLGQMLWSRRTIFMLLVVGLPVLVAVVVRMIGALDLSAMRLPTDGSVVFGLMIWGFFVRFAVPVLAVFYGTALIADEIEDRTITYLLTRPVPRASLLLGKFFAYIVCTAAVVLPAVVIIWLLMASMRESLAVSFPALAADLAVLVAGLVAYGALFAFVGATFKRPLLFGLLFVFGWENLALALPGVLKSLTVAHYLQGLVPHVLPAGPTTSMLHAMFREPMGVAEGVTGLTVIAVLCIVLAARAVGRREYVLDH